MIEIVIQLAWRPVRLRVHPDLRELLRPLQHLEQANQACELDIEIHLDLSSHESETAFYPTAAGARHILPHSRALYEREQNRIVAHYQASERLSLYELGRPLHALLSLWHSHIKAPLVHAGAVSIDGRGFLLGGRAGSGKSTAALACLGEGFVSDDMTALQGLRGHGLFATSFVCAAREGLEAKPPRYPGEEKSLIYLHPGHAVQASLDIDAIIFPSGTRPTERIAPSQALLELAPSSLLVGQLTAGQSALDELARLVRAVPSFRVAWQPDMAAALRALNVPQRST